MPYLTHEERAILRAFAENDMSATRTAKAVFLSRNGLLYKLDKIKERTGKDPRRLYDLLSLIKEP